MPIVERLSASSDCPKCDFFFRVEMIDSEDEANALLKVIAETHGEMAHGDRNTISIEVEHTSFPLTDWAGRPPRMH